MTFAKVSEHLLAANNIRTEDLGNLLDTIYQRRIDYGDIYFQSTYNEFWSLEDGMIKNAAYHNEQGVGIRAILEEKTGFAYSGQLDLNRLIECAVAARSISDADGICIAPPLNAVQYSSIYPAINPLSLYAQQDKITLLHAVDTLARSLDSRVKDVRASLTGDYEEVLIAATDGTLATDIRPLVRLSVTVLVEHDNQRESGSCGGGGRFKYQTFTEKNPLTGESLYETYTRNAVHLALTNLFAMPAPAGSMPVVLGAGWPAVLLHEAVGHGLEGDFNRKGSSVFSGKIGQQVTSPLCTIIDDGTLQGLRGSISVDDEGVPSQSTTLIENGVLKNYMFDKLNAKLFGTCSTGNGRRESYSSLPIPRMTNTYMLAGESTFDDIVSSVDYGIYAPNFSGGQVDITSGKFVFSTSEAYLIEKGKITQPVKGATLIGSGIEAMQGISMVGNNLAFDKGVGVCGKDGQSVPVGVGQPTVKVDSLTVGGTLSAK
ncbi:metalloprotease TldD [Utexia brackfieldae]|uniref:metalloprotease TldD n=1 Tax=Utexia brackfieldae TaxID=3074108 RepID=UPI00370D86B3